jgi:ATP-dependent Clp protease ATP-binding subunit ClpC
LHHDFIGTEHMLIGLVDEGTGAGAVTLRELQVDAGAVRAESAKIVKPGVWKFTFGQVPFTPRGKRVLELAAEAATSLGHRHIGTEHLLLGLVEEGQGIAAIVLLERLGLSAERIRAKVLELAPADPNAPPPLPSTSRRSRVSRLRYLGLLGLLGLLGFVDVRLGYLGFLGFLGFLGVRR